MSEALLSAPLSEPEFITRGEFSEVRSDVKTLEREMAEVRSMQTNQQTTLNEILSTVRRQGSVKAAFIAGGSGIGGGIAGALLHWLSQ